MKKPYQSLLAMALLALLCLHAPPAHAQAPGKDRGIIQSVDAGSKTIVLDKDLPAKE